MMAREDVSTAVATASWRPGSQTEDSHYRLFFSRTKSASLDSHMYVSGWLLCCH